MYPRGAKSKMTVTLPSGETVSGTTAYQDEFTVALRMRRAATVRGMRARSKSVWMRPPKRMSNCSPNIPTTIFII